LEPFRKGGFSGSPTDFRYCIFPLKHEGRSKQSGRLSNFSTIPISQSLLLSPTRSTDKPTDPAKDREKDSTNMSTVLDKIEETVSFDEQGNIPRGETGDRLPPAAPAENTAATQPSPDPAANPAAPAAPVETKTDAAAPATEPAPGTTPAKAAEPPDDAKLESDEEAALKEKYSKPEDKTGNEWQIRAYRDGEKIKKSLAPVQEVMDRIGSPDRARRGLELTADFADPEVPIADAVSKAMALSQSRFQEFHDHLYTETLDTYPDRVASDLVGENVTAAELKEGLALLRSGVKATQPQSKATDITTVEVQKPADMSDEDWEDFKVDYPKAYAAMQAEAARAAEAVAAKPTEPEKKEPELSPEAQQLKELQEQRRVEAAQRDWNENIKPVYEEIYNEAYGVVEDGLRKLGLVPDPAKDDERTIKWKNRTAEAIRDATQLEFDGPDGPKGEEDWSLCTEQQKANRTFVKRTHEAMLAKDFAAARDFKDHIKAQLDLAMQAVDQDHIDVYNAAMLQSTNPKPRDGSDHKRPELVGGTSPGGATVNKTPWLAEGYRQTNETHHQAMIRWMEENPNASFRASA